MAQKNDKIYSKKKYNLIVIGSGPAGEKAAVKAGYFGYRVALIESKAVFGGAGIHTGTLPSKTLKETALFFSGKEDKGLYGINRLLERSSSIEDFMFRKNVVSSTEAEEVSQNLERHNIDTFRGIASFIDPHHIHIQGSMEEVIQGDHIIIASGSYPYHPDNIPFDHKRIHDSDSILELARFPSSICVVGAGVIGCEYATIFSTMGCQVYLINSHDSILPFVDQELIKDLVNKMHKDKITILFNTAHTHIDTPEEEDKPLNIHLKTGETLHTDMFLFAAGRCGNTKALKCENAGIICGPRETILVDDTYRTNVPHIYAVGDVIGFPALASTSMEQGRVAVSNIFGTHDLETLPKIFPYGIYTIPELSMVGITEEEAIKQDIPYCVGRALYADMPRGKIMGAQQGFLKLVFHKQSLEVLGVHIIGKIATELIHFGMSIVEHKKTVHDIIGTIFNYPTLHDLYKYASYDGLGNLSGHKLKNVRKSL